MKNIIKKLAQSSGYDIRKKGSFESPPEFPSDFTENDIEIIKKVKPFTLTSNERINSLLQATKYVVDNNIPGDIIECGVWRGGSMMAVALKLLIEKKSKKGKKRDKGTKRKKRKKRIKKTPLINSFNNKSPDHDLNCISINPF